MSRGIEYGLLLGVLIDGTTGIILNRFNAVPYRKCLDTDPGPEFVYVDYDDEMSISVPQGLAQDQHWVPATDDEERFYCDDPEDDTRQMSMPTRMTIFFNSLGI